MQFSPVVICRNVLLLLLMADRSLRYSSVFVQPSLTSTRSHLPSFEMETLGQCCGSIVWLWLESGGKTSASCAPSSLSALPILWKNTRRLYISWPGGTSPG